MVLLRPRELRTEVAQTPTTHDFTGLAWDEDGGRGVVSPPRGQPPLVDGEPCVSSAFLCYWWCFCHWLGKHPIPGFIFRQGSMRRRTALLKKKLTMHLCKPPHLLYLPLLTLSYPFFTPSLVPYCSSDSWAGTRRAEEGSGAWSFLGSVIVEQVVEALLQHNFTHGHKLILAGSRWVSVLAWFINLLVLVRTWTVCYISLFYVPFFTLCQPLFDAAFFSTVYAGLLCVRLPLQHLFPSYCKNKNIITMMSK